ncbi:MAG: DUF2863 family protein [Pseudomonadota bacterium]
MPKNKRPAPRKNSTPPEEKEDLLSEALCALALELAEQEDRDTQSDALREKEADFQRLVRKYLNQQKDDVLYGAIELAKFEDVDAYRLLRDTVEEAAGTALLRREGAPAMEINAFAIPLFVHSTGGLVQANTFQDDAAFAALLDSFQQAGLESPKAKVVLLQHAYDLHEVDRITYGQLNAMVREAAASMTEKKLSAAPALERSMAGWTGAGFGPDDAAVELRFLLGFALKRADDPFYQAPADEQAADEYYAARMERYRKWTEQAAPLIARCLSPAGGVELNFLYQDLFFGAKQQGMAEHAMLGMMAELRQALQTHGDDCHAVLAAADVEGDMVLRVNLYGAGGSAPLASADKPLDLGCDLELEIDDVADALATIGITTVSVAQRFDAQGVPLEAHPLD